MRLLELSIRDVRGIRSLDVSPDGENLLIWGPNGSGKSAVVDALDFLLTGRISRLTGRGTSGITLSTHGPHVDSTPQEAVVRGVFRVSGLPEPVSLMRCVARPGVLECSPEVGKAVRPLLELAERGQHVLTRREILKYVATEAGTRAQEIQQLLSLTPVENTRRTLVAVEHDARQVWEQSESALREVQSDINSIVGAAEFREEAVLRFLNAQRKVLGGEPLQDLNSPPQVALTRPSTRPDPSQETRIQAEAAARTLASLLEPATTKRRADIYAELRRETDLLRSDPTLGTAVSRRELVRLGLTLLDESGRCPLCEKKWSAGALKDRLTRRLAEAEEGRKLTTSIDRLADQLKAPLGTILSSLRRLVASSDQSELSDLKEALNVWLAHVSLVESALASPLATSETFPRQATDPLAQPDSSGLVEAIRSRLRNADSVASPEEHAWDKLTRLDDALERLDRAKQRCARNEVVFERASSLSAAYRAARDEVLGELYDQVKDRFVDLYRRLHGSDEKGFTAQLAPRGAGVDFRVDFYGRGAHPPQALHSEGHQDSMGICLYLALAEKLTGGVIDLTILDDVMMSVDSDHRRELCRLLAEAFPHRQLIITTHDRTWASQLKTEGVASAKRSVQFYGWDISTGPRVLLETDLWDRLAEDMSSDDVPSAAHRLRRGGEAYFADVCDALWAPVRFRLSSRWELGELLPAAVKQLKSLLRRAKRSANAWNNKELLSGLEETESTVDQVFRRTQVEQWAVNENVHYNSWAAFSAEDFRPVMESFRDLFDLFRCSQCGTLLRVLAAGPSPAALQCSCGRVNWSFVPR
jgi:energy-coupling factor transporter ATP-binding protein EcfA2